MLTLFSRFRIFLGLHNFLELHNFFWFVWSFWPHFVFDFSLFYLLSNEFLLLSWTWSFSKNRTHSVWREVFDNLAWKSGLRAIMLRIERRDNWLCKSSTFGRPMYLLSIPVRRILLLNRLVVEARCLAFPSWNFFTLQTLLISYPFNFEFIYHLLQQPYLILQDYFLPNVRIINWFWSALDNLKVDQAGTEL